MNRTVYKLIASDEPLQVRYIGITVTPLAVRLRGHFNDELRRVWRKNHQKSDWIRDVLNRGAKVEIHPLSQHNSDEELFAAESKWIMFFCRYCALLNLDGMNGQHRRSGGKRKVETVNGS